MNKGKAAVKGTGKKARLQGDKNRGKTTNRHGGGHNKHRSRTKGRRV